uniref:Uncharacterized protein n=1 Tax=Timema cristinae TaxID=61476 RepID=A0A7R9DC73_TIMCR|nr:unnamed protein product [Timema cristinae]
MAEEVILVSSDSSTPVSPSRQNFDDDTLIYSPRVPCQSDEANLSGLLAADCETESVFNREIGLQKPHTPVSRLANTYKSVHSLSDSEESDTSPRLNSDEEFPTIMWPSKSSATFEKSRRTSPPIKSKRFKGNAFEGKERLTKEEVKERRKIEKDLKRAEKEQNRVLKAATAEALRAYKPGECLKYRIGPLVVTVNRAICGSTNLGHPGSTFRVLCSLSPITAWPTTLSPLVPYCQTLLATHCPVPLRAAILTKRRKRVRPSSPILGKIQEVVRPQPRFLVMSQVEDNEDLKRVSPFIIERVINGAAKSEVSIRKLRDGTIMIQTTTDTQSSNMMAISEIPEWSLAMTSTA